MQSIVTSVVHKAIRMRECWSELDNEWWAIIFLSHDYTRPSVNVLYILWAGGETLAHDWIYGTRAFLYLHSMPCKGPVQSRSIITCSSK